MPTYLVKDPQSGRSVKLTGDSPPTEQELNDIFANIPQAQTAQPQQGPSFGEQALGVTENIGALASGIIAEPLAGLAGIAQSLNPFAEEGAGASAVEATREALTFQPRTETGQEQQQAIGETLAPVGEVAADAQEFIGDNAFDFAKFMGASDEVAATAGALGQAAPVAALELLGFKGLNSSTIKGAKRLSQDAKKAIAQSAPTIDALKKASGKIYKELDESGVKIKPEVYDRFVSSIEAKLKKEGLRKGQHPQAFDALNAIKEEAGKPISFQDLNSLRQTAQDSAGNIMNKADARLGRIILDRVDDGIDRLADVAGKDARGARQLWRRVKVSESISGMIEGASLAASGLENGLRIEARKILRSPKKSRGFSKAELKNLKDLEQGSGAANAAKFLGKFGISEGKATSMIGSFLGGTLGNMLGGPAGSAAVLSAGQVAKQTAQKITSGKARFADQLVRAGGDARAIAKAYLNNTPKSKQSVSTLTELLLDPRVTPESIAKLPVKIKLIEDARFFASEIKRKAIKSASAGVIASPTIDLKQQEERRAQ
jgi:hypothetical protein